MHGPPLNCVPKLASSPFCIYYLHGSASVSSPTLTLLRWKGSRGENCVLNKQIFAFVLGLFINNYHMLQFILLDNISFNISPGN